MSSSGRGQVLIPWPNRLQDGSYEFDGQSHQLPLNEPEHRNAIHGLVRWAASAREPDRAVMEHVLHPQPGYPFSLMLSIEYALSDLGLRVRTTVKNVGTNPCPYGSGAHPYLTLGTATVDRLMLRVPGRTVLRPDERGLPVGTEAVQDTAYDFRQPRRIGSTTLDHAFTDLERDEDGHARVCAAVGARKLRSNQATTAGWNNEDGLIYRNARAQLAPARSENAARTNPDLR